MCIHADLESIVLPCLDILSDKDVAIASYTEREREREGGGGEREREREGEKEAYNTIATILGSLDTRTLSIERGCII